MERSEIMHLWEKVARAMCQSPSEFAWRAFETEAKAATIAVLRSLSKIELPPDVFASVDAYRAVNKAFLERVQKAWSDPAHGE